MVTIDRAPARSVDTSNLDSVPVARAWWHVLRCEWRWWAPGTLLSLLIANLLTGGWSHLLRPQTSIPFSYDSDAPWQELLVQRLREGWATSNPRMGWPFGSLLRDWPTSDLGHYLGNKLIGLVTTSWVSGFNLFFVLGYPLVFAFTYPTNRVFGLDRRRSLAAGLVFAFAPFHQMRLVHTYYTWYFYVPVFHLVALHLTRARGSSRSRPSLRTVLAGERWWLATMAVLSCFGIYNAVFGAIVVAVGCVVAASTGRVRETVVRGVAHLGALLAGLLANLAPAIWHRLRNGPDLDAVNRLAQESEIYAFRLRRLLLPRTDDPIAILRTLGRSFAGVERGESSWTNLGLVPSAGFVVLLVGLFAALAGRPVPSVRRLLAAQSLVGVLFGTVGGLGALFSYLVTPSIRGWSRISIFVAYPCTVAAFSISTRRRRRDDAPPATPGVGPIVGTVLLVAVTGFAVYEQNAWTGAAAIRRVQPAFEADRTFVVRAEQLLPEGAALYQLPYDAMPLGSAPRIGSYAQAYGFLFSKDLRWSFGTMRGRRGDLFLRALARRPVADQVEVARRLGYAAIAIDGNGYDDAGAALVTEITSLVGPPLVARSGPHGPDAWVFALPSGGDDLRGADVSTVMRRTGLLVDELGERVDGSLAQGIDFATHSVPAYVADISGLSGVEPWGRWSDATKGDAVRIRFLQPLPVGATIEIVVTPYGPDTGEDLQIAVGRSRFRRTLHPGRNVLRVPVDQRGATTITMRPSTPTTPHSLGAGNDVRQIGIGLVRLLVRCGEPCDAVVTATAGRPA